MIVVLILIFGVLGVIITSLFRTSTISSATPNQARRAYYVAESAMRYAFSELRNSDFDTAVINTLNTTTYNVNPEGNFTVNIFGPWFDSDETKEIPIGGTLDLKVPEGKLTADWMAKNPNGLWAVNYDYLELDETSAWDVITGWTQIDDTTLTITVGGNFNANKDNRICLAVRPTSDQTIIDGEDLYVAEEAKDFFPEYDGTININRVDYVYKKLHHEPANNRVMLEKVSVSAMPNVETPPSISVKNTGPWDLRDLIVLSPRNHIVIPTATSDTVTVAGTLDNAVNIFDLATVKPMTRNPDIDFNREDLDTVLTPKATNPDFIGIDNTDKTIDIGGGPALAADPEFGSVWFNANQNIGGKQEVCNAGKCQFGVGVRVFFTLDYSGDAAGLTFALINAAHNTADSSGGDLGMGELLGYGGDSRTVTTDPNDASDFLDGSGTGLPPPKMALEFDTDTDSDNLNFCSGSTKVYSNRNDPDLDIVNQDVVQYVFWGFNSLAIPCRDYRLDPAPTVTDHPTYDDNQHDDGVGFGQPLSTRNIKDKYVTSEDAAPDVLVAGVIVTVDSRKDWLNGGSSMGPWAVRLEVMRSQPTQYEYTLHAWIRQCDSTCSNLFADHPFYADTRIEYTETPHLAQTIELSPTEHTEFDSFLFGFTGATGSGTYQSAVIADFELSFIRPNDPIAGD